MEEADGTIRGERRRTGLSAAVLPGLNPIEQIFARLKVLRRKSAARTVSILWAAIGTLLESFQPDECTNDFRHAAYDSN